MEASNEIAEIVSDITTAAQEQAKGVSQVSSAIGGIDQITQVNASGSQELAARSHGLNSQSLVMNNLMGDLVEVVSGEAAKTERLKRHNTALMERMTTQVKTLSATQKLPENPQTLVSFDDDKVLAG